MSTDKIETENGPETEVEILDEKDYFVDLDEEFADAPSKQNPF